jgi:transcriptional regulator with XRE-family HTH domain
MSQFEYEQNCVVLADLMARVAIKSLEELSTVAGVSGLQIRRLQYGLISKMSVETVMKLASALQLSVGQLITKFTDNTLATDNTQSESSQDWQQEYQQLEQEMTQQATMLNSQFQQASIQTIESWLIQWPTAVAAIEKNPELPAERLIPLVRPVKQLVEQWGLETIATVGEELAYNPQYHELMTGLVEPGTKVQVRYVGYQQENKILYKAKVSPVEES